MLLFLPEALQSIKKFPKNRKKHLQLFLNLCCFYVLLVFLLGAPEKMVVGFPPT